MDYAGFLGQGDQQVGAKQDYRRIADAIAARMRALGLNQTSAAIRADVDRSLIGKKLLSGKPWSIRDDKLGQIERALEWPPGTINRIGAGESVDQLIDVERRDDGTDARLDALERDVADLAASLARLLEGRANRSAPRGARR